MPSHKRNDDAEEPAATEADLATEVDTPPVDTPEAYTDADTDTDTEAGTEDATEAPEDDARDPRRDPADYDNPGSE